MHICDQIVLVTGGAQGIGKAIVLELAKNHYDVVINYLTSNKAAALLEEEIKKNYDVRVMTIQADVSKEEEVDAMISLIEKKWGGVDILINNAGIQHVAPVDAFPVEKWNDIIAINLSSVFHTSRLALPAMREQNWGRIINIASVHGLVASKEKSAYVAAKHGVVGFTKSLALETARTGVTANALCPGWVLTPLVQQQIDKRIADGVPPELAQDQLLGEKQPSGEFVTPEQLGELALFLCSDSAVNVRGAAWNMDGGWVAQ